MTVLPNSSPPHPDASSIKTIWLAVLPPINTVIEKLGKGFQPPFILEAFALAAEPENYDVFVLQIDEPIIDKARSDKMLCGTAPKLREMYTSPQPPIWLFLFDRDQVTCVRAKMERNLQGLQLFKFDARVGWGLPLWP